ncbi:ATP-binding protein [Streptomyces calvus]|uniref:ATP-binding protein n=1 Tax=Streptomyces calvus TaxID=67282 RepID=UPI003710587C
MVPGERPQRGQEHSEALLAYSSSHVSPLTMSTPERHLALAVSPQVIALSVTDDGGTGTAPKVEHQDQEAEHGRGLGMVSALAHRVVVHGSHGGHTVTAELFTNVGPAGGHPC